MKRNITAKLVLTIMGLVFGISSTVFAQNNMPNNTVPAQGAPMIGTGYNNGMDALYGTPGANSGYVDYGYDNSISGGMIDCGPNTCSYGILPLVHDVANVALSPVYFVASLLSSGVYSDCGCAPRVKKEPCEPCDYCGNWRGCNNCGGVGCDYCVNNHSMSMNSGTGISYENNSMEYAPSNNQVEPLPEKAAPQKAAPSPTTVKKPIQTSAIMNKGRVQVIATAPAQRPVLNNRFVNPSQQGVNSVSYSSVAPMPRQAMRNNTPLVTREYQNMNQNSFSNANKHYNNQIVTNNQRNMNGNTYLGPVYQEDSMRTNNPTRMVQPQAGYPSHYTASANGLLYPGK